jgi:sulfatase modifying factor 1
MKRTALLLAVILLSLPSFSQEYMNIQMVFVKGGNFFQGCDDHNFLSEEYDNEKPLHRVNVSSYYIGKFEVTNIQYKSLMGVYPPAYIGVNYGNKDCDNCPVVKMSWDDAQEFIKKLNEKTGKHYRLPTETEWEYAARGGKYSKKYKYSGSDKLADVAWSGKPNSTTHPVGEKLDNELGIFDMAGNVAEWCQDWYGAEYYKKTIDEINPKGPAKGEKRVLRGGSYFDDDITCRSVYRSRAIPSTSQWNIGIRLALDAE